MRAKPIVLLMLLVLSAAALLGAACSDDDDDSAEGQPTTEAPGTVSGPNSSGAIVPNTFLTFEGAQYRLAEILQSDLIDDSGFTEAGEASESDVEGDPTVYTREGDDSSAYTFFAGAGEGEDALLDSWYRWEPAE
jgi:hypothetical protein